MADIVPNAENRIGGSESGVILIEHSAEVHVYRVPEPILNLIAESGLGRNLNLAFASALFGAWVSVFAVWITFDVTDPKQSATLNFSLVGMAVLFAYFALQAFRDYKRSNRALIELKRSPAIPPRG